MTQFDDKQSSSSTRPYLLRALHEWALDNNLTPQVVVAVDYPGVEVPMEYARDGQIILNIHPQSVKGLEMGNDYVLFSARFSGKPFQITLPMQAILAIYSRESGQGMVFQPDDDKTTPPPSLSGGDATSQHTNGKKGQSKSRPSHLKLVP